MKKQMIACETKWNTNNSLWNVMKNKQWLVKCNEKQTMACETNEKWMIACETKWKTNDSLWNIMKNEW